MLFWLPDCLEAALKYIFLFSFIFSSAALAGNKNHFDLRVLTYNIKGLPAFVAEGYDERRFGEIGKILAERVQAGTAPDLVLLQESFVERTRDLREAARYPFVAKGPDAARLLGVDSGLYILSKYPILDRKTRAFGEGNCDDWDCYANKGVQFARIALPGLPFSLEVFNTHMQASRGFDAVRLRQVKILAEFVKENHREGNPVLFGGDFNFRPRLQEASYRDFLAETKFLNAGEYCATHECAFRGEKTFWKSIVDHQFIAAPAALRFLPLAMARSFAAPANGLQLSDHMGFEMSYRLSWGAELGEPPSSRQKLVGAQKH